MKEALFTFCPFPGADGGLIDVFVGFTISNFSLCSDADIADVLWTDVSRLSPGDANWLLDPTKFWRLPIKESLELKFGN